MKKVQGVERMKSCLNINQSADARRGLSNEWTLQSDQWSINSIGGIFGIRTEFEKTHEKGHRGRKMRMNGENRRDKQMTSLGQWNIDEDRMTLNIETTATCSTGCLSILQSIEINWISNKSHALRRHVNTQRYIKLQTEETRKRENWPNVAVEKTTCTYRLRKRASTGTRPLLFSPEWW